MTTLYQQYKRKIKGWDWESIINQACANEGSSYLGTVFALAPSGKYYNPIANSNVSLCPVCGGRGQTRKTIVCARCGGLGSHEAYQDQEFYRALDDIASDNGGWIESGEGDPCDLFFCMSVEEDKEIEELVID
jgi:hypothetical protein